MKSKDYKSIIDYAKKENLRFAVINNFKEIDTPFEFNGLFAIDTETFEIPCCFAVERALVVCILTPNDMTPEDTGKSYNVYDNHIHGLRSICRPQYIVPDEGGAYIKLMIWCDWSESGGIEADFDECCKEAIENVRKCITNPLDFRVPCKADPTPDIYSTDEISKMYNEHYNSVEGLDCELYMNCGDSAYTTDHGVKTTMYEGMALIESY